MRYIIPVITGAFIGYFTNWLAIRMLFRPYKEKKVLGMRVPFTPGLIPKERDRIARSVGDTIGEHLLSPAVLSKALCSPKIISYIKDGVRSGVEGLKKRDVTVRDYAEKLIGEEFKNVDASLKAALGEKLNSYFEDDNNRKNIALSIEKYISNVQDSGEADEENMGLRLLTKESLKEYTRSDEFRSLAESLMQKVLKSLERSDKTIAQAIPEEISNGIDSYIYEHREGLALKLKTTLSSIPVREKLKRTISSVLEQNLGRIVTMFASTDSLSEKAIRGIESYLSNPANYDEIADMAVKVVKGMEDVRISDVSSKIQSAGSENYMESLAEAAMTVLQEGRNSEDISGQSGFDEEKLLQGIMNLLQRIFDSALECGYIKKAAYKIADRASDILWNTKVSQLASAMDSEIAEGLTEGFENIYMQVVQSKAPEIVEAVNIPEIVESEINGFDIEYAEKLITNIASKELSAITWLGALLGAVMGIVIPMLENIF